MTTTTHYSLTQPTVGGSVNVWGNLLNIDLTSIDTYIWNASFGTTVGVNTPSASGTNITLTNPMKNVQNISFTGTGKALILPAMNAASSPVAGGIFYVNNVGSYAFEIFANDGSTAVVTSLPAGQSVAIQILSNSTSNGTFQTYSYNPNLGTSTSATYPAIAGDLTSGFYTAGAAEIDVAISGTQIAKWTSSGYTIPALNTAGLVANSSAGLLSTTTALPSGTTATTQSASDNSTKVATTAQVQSAVTAATVGHLTTRSYYTSGSGTFTVPAGVTKVRVIVAGAGGGGGSGQSNGVVGTTGGSSTAVYSSTTVTGAGGLGGQWNTGVYNGVAQATGTNGDLNIPSGGGSGGTPGIDGSNYATAGYNGGLAIKDFTVNPADTITYSVGAGGAGVSGSSSTGATGSNGYVIIEY